MEGYDEGICAGYKVISGAVPPEEQFRIKICSRQEDAWMECGIICSTWTGHKIASHIQMQQNSLILLRIPILVIVKNSKTNPKSRTLNILDVKDELKQKNISIAMISVFPLYTGTTMAVLDYRDAMTELGYKVVLYQLVLPDKSKRYLESNFYIEGKKFFIKSLELPFNLLFTLPKDIPDINEDIVVLTDPALLKLKLRFPNSITIFHDLRELSEFNHNPLRRLFYRYLLRYVKEGDKILAVSKLTENNTKLLTKKDLKISVVEPCSRFSVDASIVEKKITEIRDGKTEINVLYIAADRPYKNIKLFINIARIINLMHLKVRFHFILLSKLRKSTMRLVRLKRVTNLEIIDQVDSVYDIYKKTHILLFPSLIEGFGIPLAEAMTFGIPIIYSDKPPMTDIVGNYGIQINPYLPDLWIKELIGLSNSKNYEKMAHLALERSKKYTYDKFKENLAMALKWFNDLY